MKFYKFKILIYLIFIPTSLYANTDYFNEGVSLFNNKKFNQAKFKFEQDILFNPKSEMAYLYLSKIFSNLDKKDSKILSDKSKIGNRTLFMI